MIRPLAGIVRGGPEVLIGPEASDDAGVYLHKGQGLVATADFITPVCDDPRRFGRVAAANSLSDVFAMGGEVLFALNLCCFPESGVPDGVLGEILAGAAEALDESGGALLGGHSVRDEELKFGLAVTGSVDPNRVLAITGAQPGDRLLLTKPLGTGVLVNAFKCGKTDEAGLEPALEQMERLNLEASRLALQHGVRAATDITGFGLSGHAWNLARASRVRLEIQFERLPVLPGFYRLARRGVTTGSTEANESNVSRWLTMQASLDKEQRAVLFDPQTSGGLLLSVPEDAAQGLLDELLSSGHQAAAIGSVLAGDPGLTIV